MARPYRLQGENCLYHITSRGDNRKKIFISEYDYKKFLEYVQKAKDKFRFYLYAYTLMPNHYHLQIETLKPNLSSIMHHINSSYTTYYNIKRRKCGHLFQGRYKSILVDKDSYFLELTRYIHLNPVRAKMVKSPEKYKWSSYRGYIDKKGDGYIDKEQISLYLNMRPQRYRQFVLEGIGREDTLFNKVYAGFILGRQGFIKDKLEELKEQVDSGEFAYKKELEINISAEDVLDRVEKMTGKSRSQLLNAKNRRLKEKKIAIYLLKRFINITNREIGKMFEICPTAISKAAKSVEVLMEEDSKFRKEMGRVISRFSA
ncbi:MAG: transposase [Candidatus Omnitrophica bacterium]|nr:transposase [Candidatus Omnitrophota bacterium]